MENLILKKVRSKGEIAIAVASSGIASLLLEGGSTAHSTFKLPLRPVENSTCHIPRQGKLAQILRQTRLILWDEGPNSSKDNFDCLQRSLLDVLGEDHYGKIIFICAGDFRQTLPVVVRGCRSTIVQSTVRYAKFWKTTRRFQLKINERLRLTESMETEAPLQLDCLERQRSFANWLMNIGDGVDANKMRSETVQFSPDQVVNDELELIGRVFPNMADVDPKSAILCPKNDLVDHINDKIMSMIPGERKTLLSMDKILNSNHSLDRLYPQEYLNTIRLNGIPNHKLHLKLGSIVILLRNLNINKGLCNGARMKVTDISRHLLTCVIITGKYQGDVHLIPRIWLHSIEDALPFAFARLQFPVRLAYAMTINKAQGQTLTRSGLLLNQSCFAHGQLYVGCSRVTTPEGLTVMLSAASNNETKNPVYHEVLTS